MIKLTQDEIIEFLEDIFEGYDGEPPCDIDILLKDSQEWVNYYIEQLVRLNKEEHTHTNSKIMTVFAKDLSEKLHEVLKINRIIEQDGSKTYDAYWNSIMDIYQF